MKNFLYSAERICMPLIFFIKSLAPIFFLKVNSRLGFRLHLDQREARETGQTTWYGPVVVFIVNAMGHNFLMVEWFESKEKNRI
ncbi:MAG: hypothetical protein ABIR06_14820 [Cyclobacteriaceae bacterium]